MEGCLKIAQVFKTTGTQYKWVFSFSTVQREKIKFPTF